MKNPDIHALISRALKGELTREEQAEFDRLAREDGQFKAEWEKQNALERALDRALAVLPNAPISSNFTSLVLQEALRTEPVRRPEKRRWFQFSLPRIAAGLVAMVAIGIAVRQQRESALRRDLAQTVNTFSDVAYVMSKDETPSTEIFENFEAISRLSLPAESEMDIELMVALQK